MHILSSRKILHPLWQENEDGEILRERKIRAPPAPIIVLHTTPLGYIYLNLYIIKAVFVCYLSVLTVAA